MDDKDGYLREIHRMLKDDGILSISGLAGDPDKLSQAELESLVCPHGFETLACLGSKRNYTMNFRKIKG